jgi:hypothetical protein
MESLMRNLVSFTALGLVLAAGASAAQAQTVIAQEPVVTTVPAPVAIAPAETVETVRTVHTTTGPRRRVVYHTSDRVTTTRTVISQQIVPAPAVTTIAPPVAVAPAPRFYDVVTPAPAVAPAAVVPAYRYVYEPDRILVIDPYTNIAVQSIPRY